MLLIRGDCHERLASGFRLITPAQFVFYWAIVEIPVMRIMVVMVAMMMGPISEQKMIPIISHVCVWNALIVDKLQTSEE